MAIKSGNLGHLEELVYAEIGNLWEDNSLIRHVCNSVPLRIQECIDSWGWHFED